MPKLPVISGNQAIKCFEKAGYRVIRQRGSHVRMCHKGNSTKQPLTIPRHKILGKGLMRKLLRDAELTIEEFLKLL
ncbi:MAG TPA: type II toxin-antitoxin system HicA family toxin [Planctomycetes bacterium]|nr:type II toxin-antitoxin system HicA family toxin [Planctomycetota bacterium]